MLKQDEIIEMAKQAGFSEWAVQTPNDLIAFAKLVAAKEREACAALVEREWSTKLEKILCDELASYIRARGQT